MTEFTYNNAKNASTDHINFKLNCGYYLCIFFKDDADPRSKSYLAKKLFKKLRDLIFLCKQNLLHTPKLPKQVYNKKVQL